MMGNLSTTRKIVIASLSGLSVLLLAGFVLVYFAGNDVAPAELTAEVGAGANPAAGNGIYLHPGPAAANAGGPNSPATSASEPALRVYIAGAVRQPNVYTMQPGDRLVDALAAAGGASQAANLEAVNLAVRVRDEGYYYIPSQAITSKIVAETPSSQSSPARHAPGLTAMAQLPPLAANPSTGQLPGAGTADGTTAGNSLIDLNTASQLELESLPSIGPARAGAIITYRDRNGQFAAIDEVTAVPGIGPGIFDHLQYMITVGNQP